jgi:hypothetical protein
MRPIGIRHEVAAYLASGDIQADLAALLRRWTERRRPAVLVVLDWEPPFADVYPEGELLETFPTAPLIHVAPVEEIGPGALLIFVIDEEGETAYAIPDPRVCDGPLRDTGACPRRGDRKVPASG